jgi:hypothetical protein
MFNKSSIKRAVTSYMRYIENSNLDLTSLDKALQHFKKSLLSLKHDNTEIKKVDLDPTNDTYGLFSSAEKLGLPVQAFPRLVIYADGAYVILNARAEVLERESASHRPRRNKTIVAMPGLYESSESGSEEVFEDAIADLLMGSDSSGGKITFGFDASKEYFPPLSAARGKASASTSMSTLNPTAVPFVPGAPNHTEPDPRKNGPA